jgi:PAS domain S-box-containing protein
MSQFSKDLFLNPNSHPVPLMKPALKPTDEESRLQELKLYNILDSAEEKDYNDLVNLAASICNCPISSITFVDAKRQWFKASLNMSVKETTRDISFCSHAILQTEVFIVEDASKDERFADYPNVTGGVKIRFYAGAPIVSQGGKNLGTLCVVDTQSKKLTKEQTDTLQTLATMISRLLELRLKNKSLIKNAESYQEFFENASTAQWIHDFDTFTFVAANKAAQKLYGYSEREFKKLNLFDILTIDKLEVDNIHKRLSVNKSITTVTTHKKKDGNKVIVEATVATIIDNGYNMIIATIIDLSEKLALQTDLTEEKKQTAKKIKNAALSAQLKERDFLGKELHDNITQMLASIKIYLDVAYTEEDMRMELIQKSKEYVVQTINEVRELSRRLVNESTRGLNVIEAIEELLEPYYISRLFTIHYSADDNINALPVNIKIGLLRVIQEAINNIVKYAEASNVWISLQIAKEFELIIKDDGKGFDASRETKGIGIRNMKERIEQIKGCLEIKSSIGSGTTIKVTLNLNE